MGGAAGGDTRSAEGRREFPSTCWSRIDPAGEDAEEALAELAKHYWTPIYAYIRARWNRPVEDAKDLTQEFFAWMIESGFLGKADPRRGRFRAFVKSALEHFVASGARSVSRLKRGGGRMRFPIDGIPDDAAITEKTPDRILDEVWRNGLLARAEAGLAETLRRENRTTALSVFQDYCRPENATLGYRELAARHGVTEGDVLVQLRHARARFRSILSGLVAETVRGEDDLAEELRALFGDGPA